MTDAAVLAHSADGAVVVISAGRTTYDMLTKALGNMAKANARVLGIVLNKVPKRGADAGYYGYQYQGNYTATAATVETSATPLVSNDSAMTPADAEPATRPATRRAQRTR